MWRKNEPGPFVQQFQKSEKLNFDIGKHSELVEEECHQEITELERYNDEQLTTPLMENDQEKTLTVDKRILKLQSC